MFDVVQAITRDAPRNARAGAGQGGLVVLTDAAPDSLDAAEMIARIAKGVSPVADSETRTIPETTLQAWNRDAVPTEIQRRGESQGRWLWVGVLALLAVETVMRRRGV